MPGVPVRLPSSSSCICMRRTPRADPGTRGRNRPRSQLSLLEAPRTGGAYWWGSNRLQRRLGGSGDCSPPFLCGSMRGAHTPITEGITWVCCRCSPRYCTTTGFANTVGGPETNSRVIARGTLSRRSRTRIS